MTASRHAWSARRSFPALVIAGVIFADALLARILLRADDEHVFVMGRRIEWVCGLRSRFGLPCPTCGLTRSIVLSLHGEVERAWKLAPVGPVAVFGMITFAATLLALAIGQAAAPKWESRWRDGMQKCALIYAAAATAIWLGGWALKFQAALAVR